MNGDVSVSDAEDRKRNREDDADLSENLRAMVAKQPRQSP